MSISVSGNIHDQFSITSLGLAWYHNGSRIEANDRIDISNNKTTLTISNTKDSDAGKYQVRIDLLTFGNHISPECDQLLLPVLENFALHTPATFLLQQNTLSRYSPEDIINKYFIPSYAGDYQQIFITNYTGTINSTLYHNSYYNGYYTSRDGRYYYYGSNSRFHDNIDTYYFTYNNNYNNSQNVVGHYTQVHYIYYYYYRLNICYSYWNHLIYSRYYAPFLIQYWTISSQCKFKASIPSINHTSSYALVAAPPVITSSKPMPVLLGDYLTLSCSSESLNVDWFLNDTLLSSNTTRMLVLPAVLSHNLGLYTCRRRSDNSSSQLFHVYSMGKKF